MGNRDGEEDREIYRKRDKEKSSVEREHIIICGRTVGVRVPRRWSFVCMDIEVRVKLGTEC